MKVALVCIALAAAVTASCSTSDTKPASADAEVQKKPAAGPELVGRIASVPAGKSFVLIQRYGKWEATPGQVLTTRGADERASNLRITGESLGEFTAADVQSGTLEIGDGVYSIQTLAAPAQPALPVPADASVISDVEKVQKNN